MIRRSGSVVLFFALIAGLTTALGQAARQSSPQTNQVSSAAAVDPVMPKDPNAAILLAAQVNGLAGMDRPWHLKANYQTFDADGGPKDQGVFEEWWAGPDKYKVSYTSKSFSQVQYRTGDKEWLSGDTGWPPVPEMAVAEYFAHPTPDEKVLKDQSFVSFERKLGSADLRCLQPSNLPSHPRGDANIDERVYFGTETGLRYEALSLACFDLKAPRVQLEKFDGDWFALFGNVLQVKGRYVAEQIWAKNADVPFMHASLTGLDFPAAIDDLSIAPPSSATLLPVEKDVIPGRRIRGKDVEYPSDARSKHLQGTVILEATVTQTGGIENLEVVSGPKELQRSAVDAVRTWKYKPSLLNGQPVDMRMVVAVVYTLGG